MNTVMCDQCEKVSATEGLIGWLHLEVLGIRFSHDDHEWHFCGWNCLTEFGDRKSPRAQ